MKKLAKNLLFAIAAFAAIFLNSQKAEINLKEGYIFIDFPKSSWSDSSWLYIDTRQ